jgi:microcin C transport system substrate-binding protein
VKLDRAALAAVTLLTVAGTATLARPASAPPAVWKGPAISMYGDLKYGPDFTHFEYVNPQAPRGGELKMSGSMAGQATFDNLNPFILKGVPPTLASVVFDTLMTGSDDEPFAYYGLIAETVETPADRSWVTFTVRAAARFHDGSPITADDVIWTFDSLKRRGHPQYRAYYAAVERAEKVGARAVKFTFKGGENRELPLILGQLPVLSRQYWSTRDFEKTTMEPPLGSGPYRIAAVEPGRSVTYRRVPDYWAASLPVNAGKNNFDTIRVDYFRDSTVSLEGFKAGAFDFNLESSSKQWATGYDGPPLRQGWIKMETIPNQNPQGMQGFVFNTRRPIFRDPRVRQALTAAFDFEWSNAHLFYGAYRRTASYFANSELAASGLPSVEELEVLEPLRSQLPAEVFTREYRPPVSDGSGYDRRNLLASIALLREAGWVVRDGRLVNAKTGEPMEFEILLDDSTWERIALPMARNLERLGVRARVRTVDTPQYQYRTDHFDFDMIVSIWGQSLSPGNEQRDFWGSEVADRPGSRNTPGIKSPGIDKLIDLVISAPDRQSLVTRTRALDRTLLWGHYVIPNFHLAAYRVAYWDKFGRPAVSPKYALGFPDTWWFDAAKASALRQRRDSAR